MKKIIIFLISILTVINLCACSGEISDKALRKMLQKDGYSSSEIESSKVETTLDLNNDIQGLDESDKNKLVLISINDYYTYAIVNTETEKFIDIQFGFTPLNVVQCEIFGSDKDVNIENMSILKKYIEKYGVNCLNEKQYAEEYLREITGTNGIIDTSEAQDIISNSTTQIFPDIESSNDVTVLFEENSAVPMYYATEYSNYVYNWNNIFDESVYEVWQANTDLQTQKTMIALYGQPYVLESGWAVVDSNLNEVGLYDSLDDIKKSLLNRPEKTNPPKKEKIKVSGGSDIAMKIGDITVSKGDIAILIETYWQNTNDFNRLKNLVVDEMKESAISYAIVQAKGITLTSGEQSDLRDKKSNYIVLFGSQSDYEKELKKKDASDKNFEMFIAHSLYKSKLEEAANISDVTEEEAKTYFKNNYFRAKHVLLTIDSNEDKNVVKQRAESILKRAKSGENFDELISAFSEDPGCAKNPDGYIFTYDDMVSEFEDAVKSIQPGEFAFCESDYGYHIVQRLPLDESEPKFNELFEKNKDAIINSATEKKLENAIKTMAKESGITVEIYNDIIDTISIDN